MSPARTRLQINVPVIRSMVKITTSCMKCMIHAETRPPVSYMLRDIYQPRRPLIKTPTTPLGAP